MTDDVLQDAQDQQRLHDAVGDEPQPVPEGVNLYWGNGEGREDLYELWRGEPIDEATAAGRQPFRMESSKTGPYTEVRWYSRYGTVPYFTARVLELPFTDESIRLYWECVAKVDGTRTQMLWAGQLGGDGPAMRAAGLYVVNRAPKELAAFRKSDRPLDIYRWDNMGGI